MKSNSSTIKVLTLLIAVAVSTNLYAAKIEGVNFKKSYIAKDKKLELKGAGLLRYLRFIKAYVGAFYLDENATIDEALADRAKRIEVEYFHAIKGKDFGPEWQWPG